MRPLFLVLTFIAQTTAASFPPPITSEQPVSERVFTAPAGDQRMLGIASDGNIGLAVWNDSRRAANDVYGSRIDANGVPLDPQGIPIAANTSDGAVIWNGSNFVVASQRGSDDTFTFVTADGAIVGRKTMTLFSMIVAATMGSGPDARFLFVGSGKATIVDSNANIVMANIQLKMPVSPSLVVAAGAANEFLLLHTNEEAVMHHLYADRVDRDGKFLGTADTGIDSNVIGSTLALAGDSDGYLLVGRGLLEREIIVAHLDRNGVRTSQRILVPFQSGLRVSVNPSAKPAVLRDGDHYELVWTTSDADGSAHTWRFIEPADGTSQAPPVRILDWTGTGYSTTIGKVASQPVVVTDAYRDGVSTNIDPVATPIGNSLSSTAAQQTTPQVAAIGNTHAVIWNEFGPDGSAHLNLRRFTGSSPGPIVEVASNANGRAITGRIAAANGTYAIAWTTSEVLGSGTNYLVRRMSAATGEWLDPEPVPLAVAFDLVLAGNNDTVLAAYTVRCQHRCLRARAIATDTAAVFRAAETVIPGTTTANQLAMASNGRDYLIAWNDFFCDYPCDASVPRRILAMRIGADGRALTSQPVVIDQNDNYAAYPAVAWTGSQYAVNWDANAVIAGRHVSALGRLDAINTVLAQSHAPQLVAGGHNLFLLYTVLTGDTVRLEGVIVDPESLTAIGEPSLLVTEQPYPGSVAAAGLPSGIVIAYDRVDPAAANVGRVFTRIFGDAPRRRAARR
jgi:hypothetical protein